MLVDGKRLLVTGVLTGTSTATLVARLAADQGASVVLASPGGETLSLARQVATQLPGPPPVVELDVTSAEDLAALPDRLAPHVDGLDGVLHAVGCTSATAPGAGLLGTSWADAGAGLRASTWSYAALAHACAPLWAPSASYVGLAPPAAPGASGWTGVARAGLESANRYLARDLGPRGVRVNLVASERPGAPTTSGSGADALARACVALLSDWFPRTTGSVVRVDGGSGAVGV